MSDEEVVALVLEEVLAELPERLRKALKNVEFVIRDLGPLCLGLYHGVPFPKKGSLGYTFVLPDQIIVSPRSIRRIAPSDEEFREKVREVLLHEIGHYFGFGEEEIRRLLWSQGEWA